MVDIVKDEKSGLPCLKDLDNNSILFSSCIDSLQIYGGDKWITLDRDMVSKLSLVLMTWLNTNEINISEPKSVSNSLLKEGVVVRFKCKGIENPIIGSIISGIEIREDYVNGYIFKNKYVKISYFDPLYEKVVESLIDIRDIINIEEIKAL